MDVTRYDSDSDTFLTEAQFHEKCLTKKRSEVRACEITIARKGKMIQELIESKELAQKKLEKARLAPEEFLEKMKNCKE